MGTVRLSRLGDRARLFHARGLATMQLVSRDRSMILSITEPALGFTLSLDGHLWLFDARLEIIGSVLPPSGHIDARTPDACPGCTDFSIRTYASEVR